MTAMEKINQNVDDAVTIYLRRTGMSQRELASRFPLSELQFSRKRKGEADWKLTELVMLSDFIDKPISELMAV